MEVLHVYLHFDRCYVISVHIIFMDVVIPIYFSRVVCVSITRFEPDVYRCVLIFGRFPIIPFFKWVECESTVGEVIITTAGMVRPENLWHLQSYFG